MVSSALSLCAALLLAAFSAVSKAQLVWQTVYVTSLPPVSYVNPHSGASGPIVTADGIPFNDPYNASRDAKCLLSPEQQAAILSEFSHYTMAPLQVKRPARSSTAW